MEENENSDLKLYAEKVLMRSKDNVSDDKAILERMQDKVIILKETNEVEVRYKDRRPLVLIPLYLIGKLMGHKILKLFNDSTASVKDISKSLNMPVQALSRPLGILTGDLIEKTDEGYKMRAFKIMDFLDSLDKEEPVVSVAPRRKSNKSNKPEVKEEKQEQIKLKLEGIAEFAKFLEVDEDKIRKLFFFRENDFRIINPKFIQSKDTAEFQLDMTLAHLMVLKYCFGEEKGHASFLRNKLKLMGVQSLTNLTTNLHKFPEYIIHDAGRWGSRNNYFVITHPGEERIKTMIKNYIDKEEDGNDKTKGSSQ